MLLRCDNSVYGEGLLATPDYLRCGISGHTSIMMYSKTVWSDHLHLHLKKLETWPNKTPLLVRRSRTSMALGGDLRPWKYLPEDSITSCKCLPGTCSYRKNLILEEQMRSSVVTMFCRSHLVMSLPSISWASKIILSILSAIRITG